MMKKIKYIILSLSLIAGFGLTMLPTNVGALNVLKDACTGSSANTAICKASTTDSATKLVGTLVNVLLYVLGAVSIIVIVISGFFYVTANGDSTAITKAKNTLMYAVIGLVVALLAYALVNFVITKFKV